MLIVSCAIVRVLRKMKRRRKKENEYGLTPTRPLLEPMKKYNFFSPERKANEENIYYFVRVAIATIGIFSP